MSVPTPRQSFDLPKNVVEFEHQPKQCHSVRAKSASYADLSPFLKKPSPDSSRIYTPSIPFKTEDLLSLAIPQSISPCGFLQSLNGIAQHPTKRAESKQERLLYTRQAFTPTTQYSKKNDAPIITEIPSKSTTSKHVFGKRSGKLKSARLSVFRGKPTELHQSFDQEVLTPNTNQFASFKPESTLKLKNKRAMTVPAAIPHNTVNSLIKESFLVRAKTADPNDTQKQLRLKEIREGAILNKLFSDGGRSKLPELGLDSFNLILSQDALQNAPTPCPSNYIAPELPNIQCKTFVKFKSSEECNNQLKSHKQFIISMGRVTKSSEAYMHFFQVVSSLIPDTLIYYFIDRLEHFCLDFFVQWAECSIEKIIQMLTRPRIQFHFLNSELMDCITNYNEVNSIVSAVGQRYKGQNAKYAAAYKVQATWKMYIVRRDYLNFIKRIRVGRRILRMWKISQCKERFKQLFKKRIEENILLHNQRIKEFKSNWAQIKAQKRVIVHLPSMSFGTSCNSKHNNMSAWQTRQLGRLVDILDPNVSVVYVTTLMPTEVEKFFKQAIEYTFNLAELVRSKRLLLISLKKPNHFSNTVSLSTILMCNPTALSKISAFIKDIPAYIVPGIFSWQEAELSNYLDIPVFGSLEVFAEFSHKRSTQRDFISKCPLLSPPGLSHFNDELDFYNKVNDLMTQNPSISRWILKIDHEMEGRGLAYFDVEDVLAQNEFQADEDPEESETRRWLTTKNKDCFKHFLKPKLSNCVRICRKDLWVSWNCYVQALISCGGIIEACPVTVNPEINCIDYPIVHVVIEPDKNVRLVSSSLLLATNPFTQWGSIFPQYSVGHQTLMTHVDQIAHECAEQGILGHVTFEFVLWRHPISYERAIWCIAVKPYFTENLSQAYYMLFMSCCLAAHTDGKIYFNLNSARYLNLRYISKVPFVDMDQVRKASHTEHLDDDSNYEERVGIYTCRFSHQNFEIMSTQLFQSMCIESGMTFDSKWKIGTQIPLIESLGNQSYPMVCINRSLETALETILQNYVIIERRLSGTVKVKSNFMEASNFLATLLSNIRPYKYAHKPAIIKNLAQLSDLEVVLNQHILLPLSRMVGVISDEMSLTPKKSSAKGGMSSTTINLLNAGVPSKALAGFYTDFGREKLDISDKSSLRNATRIPPGLPMDEYMAIMEHLAGIDDVFDSSITIPLDLTTHDIRPASAQSNPQNVRPFSANTMSDSFNIPTIQLQSVQSEDVKQVESNVSQPLSQTTNDSILHPAFSESPKKLAIHPHIVSRQHGGSKTNSPKLTQRKNRTLEVGSPMSQLSTTLPILNSNENNESTFKPKSSQRSIHKTDTVMHTKASKK
ncbi:hypothetical protein BDEG_26187 [Batrachochytrium dendrobatidis JEL423]|uniref:IQCH-like ATP-grasp domain-containing protein n=1 Tax=Batrachochytrium dendrobatidis (strain JEL423) TaxID=403673 RepID=A0A177WRR5_BATDL|nr:hypothetical protein BDEG_26187 [Batrachochytrium dendrobatidis JEL423]